MNISRIIILFVCSMSILYTQPTYSKGLNRTKELPKSVLEEDTDLKNIEDISEGILGDILRTIPEHRMQNAIVFIPEVQYTSHGYSVVTMFDSIFTQALVGSFTKHNIAIAPYAEKTAIMKEYEVSLQKKIQERASFEANNKNQIALLEQEGNNIKENIQGLEQELAVRKASLHQEGLTLTNARQANRSLIEKQEANISAEKSVHSSILRIKNEIMLLQDEISQLRIAEQKTIREINHAYTLKDSVDIILSIKETPIVEVNSMEEKKKDAYRDYSKQNIINKEENLKKIRKGIEEREAKILAKKNEITQQEAQLIALQNNTPTVTTALEQSRYKISILEKEYTTKTQAVLEQERILQQSKQKALSIENKIEQLKNMNPIALPAVYQVKISYTNVESVLFITAEVSSGLQNTTVYLSKHTARVTPYTAMLLQQEPLSLTPYRVRSVPVSKPKVSKTVILSKERGLH